MQKELLNPETFFSQLESLSDEELLDFILAWHLRGEEAEELCAFVEYIRSIQPLIDTEMNLIDCCGTGGDQADTFNISTAAAIVAAGAGVKIAKHGGRSTTSNSGSVDVLEALGFNPNLSSDEQTYSQETESLKNYNLAFLASKVTGKLLGRVKQLAKQNKTTSFISLLGPLTNPMKLSGHLLGVGKEKWLELMADSLILLNKNGNFRAMVVHSAHDLEDSVSYRMDEISAVSSTEIIEIICSKNAEPVKKRYVFSPEDIGLGLGKFEDLKGAGPEGNAKIILDILDSCGDDSLDPFNSDSYNDPDKRAKLSKFNSVCLNAGMLIYLAGLAEDPKSGFEKALDAIRTGAAKSNFAALTAFHT